jgi:pantoate--beta-alanine ligase
MIAAQIEKVQDIKSLKSLIKVAKKNQQSIGFVPTMGALHQGHLKLVKQAKSECDLVIVSIFINPTQFNNQEDFDKYPSTLDKDLELIEGIGDIAFVPSIEEIYNNYNIKEFDFGTLEDVMEGPNRPGHFKGVANVVKRLFEITEADFAYFGEKDFQQLCIIRKMVIIENIDINIKPVETERNEKGLALSSRNIRLSTDGIEKASLIYKTLLKAKEDILQNKMIRKTCEKATSALEQKGFKIEYLEVRDHETLAITKDTNFENARIFIVAWLEGVRLIDNLKL